MEKKAAQPGQRAYMNKSIRPWPEAALGNKPLSRPPTPNPSSSEALHSRHAIRSSGFSSPSTFPSSSRSPNVSSLLATMPEKNQESAGAAAAGHPTAPHRMAHPTWRVCQWNGATAAGASGGRWHRSDRGGPVSGVDLDAGPASDRDNVLTRGRCATVAPAR